MLYLQAKRSLYKQMPQNGKKLVAVLITFMSIIKKMEKKKLERVLYIWYPIIFKGQIEALLDLKSEINLMSQVFAYQLGLKIRKINVGA